MADIVPSWMWRDPGEIIEQLLARPARDQVPRVVIQPAARAATRDRYYTTARRVRVKQLMKGKR